MSSRKKRESFEYEALQRPEAVAAYLHALADGLESGELNLTDGNVQMKLIPNGLFRFRLRARSRPRETHISLKLTWRPADLEAVANKSLSIGVAAD